MPLYEHVFLARQEVSNQQVEAMIKEFSQVITDTGGTVGKTEYWGLKGLAYKIKKSRKAHYALMNIDATPAAVAEMERRMGLSNDVLRFLTLRVEAHEAEPSVQMRKGEDRREGERGGFRGGDRGGFRGGDREGGSTFRSRPPGGGFRGPREGGDREGGGPRPPRPPREPREPQSGSEG